MRFISASMGPHFFKCGKNESEAGLGGFWPCFNGAALFQVRKVHRRLYVRFPRHSFNGAALFQVRKVTIVNISLPFTSGASMGPHFFKCGKWHSINRVAMKTRASMGPHFFKCGKTPRYPRYPRYPPASMGPHFFKCGKLASGVASALRK